MFDDFWSKLNLSNLVTGSCVMPFLQVCAFYILDTECGLYKHHGMVSGSNPSFVFLLIIKSTVTLDT